MGLNSLDLNSEGTRFKQVPLSEFALGAERAACIEDKLKNLVTKEYWSPEFQAWRQFLEDYLISGTNPTLAEQYLQYMRLSSLYTAPETSTGKVFSEWENLARMPGFNRIAFDTIQWSEVEDFIHKASVINSNYKVIRRSLQSIPDITQVVRSMSLDGTYESFIQMAYLYCQNQVEGFVWPDVNLYRERTKQWVSEFMASFREVQQFIADKQEAYPFYNEKSLECLSRIFGLMFQPQDGSPLLTVSDGLHAINSVAADQVIAIANSTPAMYAPPFSRTDVWNILSSSTVESTGKAKDSWALYTIQWPSIRGAIGYANEFVNSVQTGELVNKLLDAKRLQLARFKEVEQTFDEYVSNLRVRGFIK